SIGLVVSMAVVVVALMIWFCIHFMKSTVDGDGPADRWMNVGSNVTVVLLVIAAGLLGARISMISGVEARLKSIEEMCELERMSSGFNRFARSVSGGSAALVVFLMCVGGVLDGKAMPKLDVGDQTLLHGIKLPAQAHLLVLCVLAGWSENLLTTKL